MPIRYRISRAQNTVVLHYSGEIHDAEFVDAYRRLYRDENWRPGVNEFVDLRDQSISGVTARAMERVSALVQAAFAGTDASMKTAILVSTDLSYGLGRMYVGVAQTPVESVRVFRDADEALSWLGAGPEVLEAIQDLKS